MRSGTSTLHGVREKKVMRARVGNREWDTVDKSHNVAYGAYVN